MLYNYAITFGPGILLDHGVAALDEILPIPYGAILLLSPISITQH